MPVQKDNDVFTLFSAFFYQNSPVPAISYIHPIQAGKAIALFNLGIEGDDAGENISALNPNFSELTVAYYIWKNYNSTVLPYWGLCHYRRYFCTHLNVLKVRKEYRFTDHNKAFKKIFTPKLYAEIEKNLLAGKVITPIPYRFIKLKKWSVKKQYFKDHDEVSWNYMEAAVAKLFPEYSNSFSALGNGLTCCWYNMLIAGWDFWDGYLNFLFAILFEVKKNLIISQNPGQIRIFGNLSERLLSTYLLHQKKHYALKIHPMPIAYLV